MSCGIKKAPIAQLCQGSQELGSQHLPLPHRTPRHPGGDGLKFTSLSSPAIFYSFSEPWLGWGALVERTAELSFHLQEYLYLFCSFFKKLL